MEIDSSILGKEKIVRCSWYEANDNTYFMKSIPRNLIRFYQVAKDRNGTDDIPPIETGGQEVLGWQYWRSDESDVRLLIRSSHRKGKKKGENGSEKRREMSERPNGQDQWIKTKT